MRLIFTIAILVSVTNARAAVDFARDIQPILSEHCFKCHGKEKRKGGLRLTNRRDAFTPGDSGDLSIVPGKSAESPLYLSLLSKDKTERMPQKTDPLSARQIALIKQWIDEGAVWPASEVKPEHWAYTKPKRPAPPKVQGASWPRNAIDHFILSRLEQQGLKPSPRADRARLLRRVYLDLIGLPPTPQQVDAFIADRSPDAFEKVIDELLKSARFGEKWARRWLDLARYADSNGFQADQLRDSWAFRDWVIDAMNADMPFDQFTIEQIAGDLLPNATIEQRIATGFHRTPTCNVEAGVHPEENRVNQVVDRVNTTGMVWLGSTIECTQCHNHPYDPFSQEEYYKLFAFFNNTPLEVRNPSGKGVSFSFWGPTMDLPLDESSKTQYERLKKQYDVALAEQKKSSGNAGAARRKWEIDFVAALKKAPQWQTLDVVSFDSTGGEDHRILKDGSVLLGGSVPGTTNYTIKVRSKMKGVTAFRIDALTHESLPGTGPGRGDVVRRNFILSEFAVTDASGKDIALHSAKADFSQKNWEIQKAIDGNQKTGWAIGPQFGESHWASFETDKAVGDGTVTSYTFTLDQNYGRGRVLGRVRLSAISGNPNAIDVPSNIAAILMKTKRSRQEKKALDAYYGKASPSKKKLDQRIAALKKQMDAIKPATTLVMVEEKKRKTSVMLRGDYLNPGKTVQSGTPQSLNKWKAQYPNNRLGFAQWLVDPDNPLVARVTVNRWWGEIMGQGIVKTVEDLGTQSEAPTHPKLLDWLAVEFIANGYSMKKLIKTIVMSATYQQSSKVTPQLLKVDADNRLFARGPRFRMSAEMIRDNALAISGLLSTKMGGRPIYPPQPDGLWRQTGRNEPKYIAATNEDRFRRGIYVIWRRAAPYPSFVNFDGPDRSTCHPQRSRTNTPMQALTLMNDEAYVEMALALANRIASRKGTVSNRVEYGFRLTLSRKPSAAESRYLGEVFERELAYFASNVAEADTLVSSVSGYKAPASVDRKKLAAWFVVANVLLNLDETVTRG